MPTKQSVWDRPGIAADRALVESNLSTSFQLASFRAASSPHNGDWLFALPISPCGLCLDDEAVRIAVSVRLGMAICVPNNCHCGSLVDAHGLHSFVYRKVPGKITRHHALNDLVAHAFTSAGIPSSKEPHGLVPSDGKWPDGLTLVPWKGGKPLAWDVTAVCTVADSYVAATAKEAAAAAERAAELKISKYSGLEDKCVFQPIAVESLGSDVSPCPCPCP